LALLPAVISILQLAATLTLLISDWIKIRQILGPLRIVFKAFTALFRRELRLITTIITTLVSNLQLLPIDATIITRASPLQPRRATITTTIIILAGRLQVL
jgi:hypothetical protein